MTNPHHKSLQGALQAEGENVSKLEKADILVKPHIQSIVILKDWHFPHHMYNRNINFSNFPYILSVQELTVRHLQKLAAAQRLVLGARSPVEELARFRQGYATCAQVGGKGNVAAKTQILYRLLSGGGTVPFLLPWR